MRKHLQVCRFEKRGEKNNLKRFLNINRFTNYKKLTVALVFCMIITGCGNRKEVVVSDYGSTEINSAASYSANDYYVADDEDSKVVFDIDWQDSFEANDISYNLNCFYHKENDLNSLNRYLVKRISDSGDMDEGIVSSLFGNTGRRVLSISNDKKAEYVPFLYKFKSLKSILDKTPRNTEYDDFECFVNYDSVITPGTTETCKWEDNDKYYIHIYEGKYQNMRFGLILAYDKIEQTRYIYFHPINIDEYYPEKSIKTVMLRNSVDENGYPCIGNECTFSYSDVQDQINVFLSERLGINEAESGLGVKYDVCSERLRPFIGYTGNLNTGSITESISQVVFSDSDYVHSIIEYSPTFNRNGIEMKNTDQFPRSVELLAEQDDRMKESLEKRNPFLNSLWDPYKYLDWNEAEEGNVSYTYDGYALYLNPGFMNSYDITDEYGYLSKDYIDVAPVNSGVVEVTSKGIFGADIVQMIKVEKESPAHILKTDCVKDILINSLKSQEFKKIVNAGSEVLVSGTNLINYYNEKASIYAPTWDFAVYVFSEKQLEELSETEILVGDVTDTSQVVIPDVVHIYIDAESGEVCGIVKD